MNDILKIIFYIIAFLPVFLIPYIGYRIIKSYFINSDKIVKKVKKYLPEDFQQKKEEKEIGETEKRLTRLQQKRDFLMPRYHKKMFREEKLEPISVDQEIEIEELEEEIIFLKQKITYLKENEQKCRQKDMQ